MTAQRREALLLCVAATLALWPMAPRQAQAGARPVKIVLAWVSPDAAAARDCQSQIGGALFKGETTINYTSRAAITGRLGLDSRSFDGAWFDLDDKRFVEGLKNIRGIKSETEDAVVMVSCEPGRRRVQAVVLAQGKYVTRFRAEHIEVTRPFLSSLAKGLIDAAMEGFIP